MTTYLVTYDLHRPGQNYPGLIGELQRQRGVRILLSTWLVHSGGSALQLINALEPHIDGSDRIFVSTVEGNWAFNNILNDEAAKRLLPP